MRNARHLQRSTGPAPQSASSSGERKPAACWRTKQCSFSHRLALSAVSVLVRAGRSSPAVPNENEVIRLFGLNVLVVSSSVSDPMVPAGESNRVCIDPVLGPGVQAGQTWSRVYKADRELGTAHDAKRGCENYDEAADHFFQSERLRRSVKW